MKKIIFLLCFIFLFIGIICAKGLNNPLKGKIIILDAGHGGVDSGTVVANILEKDLNLKVVLKLKEALNKQGVDVLLTRDGDYDLSKPNAQRRKKSDFDNRIKLINNSKADLYLSIHMNYLDDSKYYGAQVFYTDGNQEIAEYIQKEFNTTLDSKLDIRKIDQSIYMYKQLNVPGVLIECGFLSNEKERNLLLTDNYQELIVDSILDAIIKYY